MNYIDEQRRLNLKRSTWQVLGRPLPQGPLQIPCQFSYFALECSLNRMHGNEISLVKVGIKHTKRVVAAIREGKKDLSSVKFWRGDRKCDKDYKEAGNV